MPSSRVRNRVGAATAGVLAAIMALPAAATGAPATPGAPGIGDPYFPKYGNGGYDVASYDINVDYDPGTEILTGTTKIVARATQDLTTFNLDLALKAGEVTVDGSPAVVKQDQLELTVRPKKWLRAGATFTVTVRYGGIPAQTKIPTTIVTPWHRTPTGAVAAGQPEGSVLWYPSNDHPRDKATFKVSATVPSDRQAISNGLPAEKRSAAGGKKATWTWTDPTPKATYLAFLAIGKYDITTTRSPLGKPNVSAVEQGTPNADVIKKDMARTNVVVNWLQKQYGTYQFNSIGGVVPNSNLGFALETQTRPTYDRGYWSSGKQSDGILVHENGHQWFGDSVSINGWKDTWLNEGFATFSTWLWSEQHGLGDAQDTFDTAYARYPANSSFWQVKAGDPGVKGAFSGRIYTGGAMILQALRNRMGDPKFFRLLRTWAATHAGGNGSIEQFTALANQIAGRDLDPFFQNWLYTAARPDPTPENGFPVNAAARTGAKPDVPKSWPELQRIADTHPKH